MELENRNFNIIMICIILVLSVSLIYMIFAIKRNEESRVLFNINDIVNYTWKDNKNEFSMSKNKATFIINDKKILDNTKVIFDTSTGEIKYNGNDKIYIRSVSNNTITIWYQKDDYILNKVIETR